MAGVQAAFPNLDDETLAQLMDNFGGDEGLVMQFLAESGDNPAKKAKAEGPEEKKYPPATLETLQPRFPDVDAALLQDVCTACNGDWNKAMTQLLSYGLIPVFAVNEEKEKRERERKAKEEEEEEKKRKAAEEELARIEEQRKKERKATLPSLKEIFPDVEDDILREAADDCGGRWQAAIERLQSYGFTPQKAEKVATLETLSAAFPHLDVDLLRDVADSCQGNWKKSLTQLAEFGCLPEDEVDLPQEESWPEYDRETSDNYFDREDTGHSDEDDVYTAALATGEDLKKAKQAHETSELMKQNMARIARQMEDVEKLLKERDEQKKLGPQSCRGMSKAELRNSLQRGDSSAHATKCFEKMLEREAEHCGEYVVFYHSYSFAALMYEVQAAIAKVLYGLPDGFGALPRLLKEPFSGKPHVSLLLADFNTMGQQDHDPRFRQLAISVSVSLLAPSSEAPPHSVFSAGYSCNDLSFHGILLNLFKTLGLSNGEAESLIRDVVAFGNKWGLSGDMYAATNNGCYSRSGNKGHMLQMFINTSVVDDLAYASHAMGVVDDTRNPLSKYLTGKKWPDGQARIFVHPSMFMNPKQVKIYHYAADQSLHQKRLQFQTELVKVLYPLLGKPEKLVRAFKGVEGM